MPNFVFAMLGVIALTFGIVMLHQRIDNRIDRAGEL